ncbi:MAG: aspartate aminotransferase family protein [Spirochaetes bacterium]|nr:aspartate aminotransferase family protein [Spirochaetota bacterium]
MNKEKIMDLYARFVSPGKVLMYKKYDIALVPHKRQGVFIYDITGKRYINCHCNGGVFNVGHRNKKIMDAVKKAMQRYDIGNHHLISQPKAMLAQKLAATMPAGLNQVVYGVSGGEAIDTAIKIARAVTGRPKIISAVGGYHGHTGFALAAGDEKFKKPFEPLAPGFLQVPFNDIEAMKAVIDEQTAAVILETIPATLGIVVPDKDYFKKVSEFCHSKGALLIIDEVQTGFGRTGKLWGFEHFDVVPDIVVLGKGMSGGIYPITATIYKEDYAFFFKENPFIHISTFGGSEIGCFAAMAVLDMCDSSLLSHVNKMAQYFIKKLTALSSQYSKSSFSVRGLGLMMGLAFADETTALFMVKLLFDNGVYVVYSGNDPRVIQFLPPLIITQREADLVIAAVEKSLKALS